MAFRRGPVRAPGRLGPDAVAVVHRGTQGPLLRSGRLSDADPGLPLPALALGPGGVGDDPAGTGVRPDRRGGVVSDTPARRRLSHCARTAPRRSAAAPERRLALRRRHRLEDAVRRLPRLETSVTNSGTVPDFVTPRARRRGRRGPTWSRRR